ncbi:hypothetical protein J3R83DRAFT_8632 [Lanmaoa asiatica]|nr:hypothetical protein J3R83DRAFT_8632 [Lanmaoa asiatica]
MKQIPAIELRPLCLHVYRVGGIWGNDKIVRADDRKTLRYYLKGTRLAGNWQLALHIGGRDGALVCHAKSPYLGPPMTVTDPGPINITIGPERHTVEVHHGNGGTYSFRGLDDQEYCWRPSSVLWGNKMECLNSQHQVMATYRIRLFAMSKDGELRIHQV